MDEGVAHEIITNAEDCADVVTSLWLKLLRMGGGGGVVLAGVEVGEESSERRSADGKIVTYMSEVLVLVGRFG